MAKTHGLWSRDSRTYRCWQSMKQRCFNPKADQYKNYGARGISVCDRWLESFLNFYKDMGSMPDGMTIERKNNDGNYEPSNCRWASRAEQCRNRRGCRHFEYQGRRMTLNEWARFFNIHPATLRSRLKIGRSFSDSIKQNKV